jgi:hypothetical protein
MKPAGAQEDSFVGHRDGRAAVHGPQIVRSPDDQQMSFDAGGSAQ